MSADYLFARSLKKPVHAKKKLASDSLFAVRLCWAKIRLRGNLFDIFAGPEQSWKTMKRCFQKILRKITSVFLLGRSSSSRSWHSDTRSPRSNARLNDRDSRIPTDCSGLRSHAIGHGWTEAP